jgi:hypothetical protein
MDKLEQIQIGSEKRIMINTKKEPVFKKEKSPFTINDYHKQGLSQDKIAFGISISIVGIGFIVLVYCIIFGVTTKSGVDWAAIVGGTINEFIGGTIFVISNAARKTNNDYFEKLNKRQNIERALEILKNNIDDHDKKQAKILEYTDKLVEI